MTTEPRQPLQPSPRRRLRRAIAIVSIALVVTVVGAGMVAKDVLGTGRLFDRAVAKVDRFLAGPVLYL